MHIREGMRDMSVSLFTLSGLLFENSAKCLAGTSLIINKGEKARLE